jgi:hypothetical protein
MSRQTTEPLRRLRWTGSGRTKARGKRGVNLGSIGQRASELRCSAPGRTRTCGLAIRSRLLYPAELRGPGVSEQPSDGVLPTCT